MRKSPVSRKPLEPQLPPDLAFGLTEEIPLKMIRCVICASDTQEGSPENMCWVCRRLKISAWRDVEQQIPAQE